MNKTVLGPHTCTSVNQPEDFPGEGNRVAWGRDERQGWDWLFGTGGPGKEGCQLSRDLKGGRSLVCAGAGWGGEGGRKTVGVL